MTFDQTLGLGAFAGSRRTQKNDSHDGETNAPWTRKNGRHVTGRSHTGQRRGRSGKGFGTPEF